MSDLFFQRCLTVGERLGVPALCYLLLFLVCWRTLKWVGDRLVEVGHFAAPLIRRGVESHTRFLDTTSSEMPRTTTTLGEIRDWLRGRWPPTPTGPAAKG